MGDQSSQYVVYQLGWVQSEFGDDRYLRRIPRNDPVADFHTFDAAEANRAERESELRRRANPFRYGGAALYFQSSLDAPRLHDWLLDAGIDPPVDQSTHAKWCEWWDAFAHTWNEEQRAHAWQALDKVRFFEIVEEHADRKAYVIVEINWTWNDEPTLYADYEGGNIVRAYRSRARAQAECDRLNSERQAQAEHQNANSFDTNGRRGVERDDRSLIHDTVFFEVVEIEVNSLGAPS